MGPAAADDGVEPLPRAFTAGRIEGAFLVLRALAGGRSALRSDSE